MIKKFLAEVKKIAIEDSGKTAGGAVGGGVGLAVGGVLGGPGGAALGAMLGKPIGGWVGKAAGKLCGKNKKKSDGGEVALFQYNKNATVLINGVETRLDAVSNNLTRLAAATSAAIGDLRGDVAEVGANVAVLRDDVDLLHIKTDALRGAVDDLREYAARFDDNFERFFASGLDSGFDLLAKATRATSESRFEFFCNQAETELNRASHLLKNERALTAKLGEATASLMTGDLANAMAALEDARRLKFVASEPNANYWAFLSARLEIRDLLAALGGQQTASECVDEVASCVGRLVVFPEASEETRKNALELGAAVLDWKKGDLQGTARRLLTLAKDADPTVKKMATGFYECVFDEKIADSLGGKPALQEPKAGTRKVLTIKGVDFAFRYCPAGTFQMGSPSSEAGRGDDETRHEVTLTKGFWMLETSVTQGMYRAITGSNPSSFKSGDNYPVESVSWFDSQSFCESLNALGVAPEGFAFRLPTEAEWEYACRAGTDTPYFWGSTLNGDKANCDGNYPYGGVSKGRYLSKTSAVGSYTPNGWGLYDMHGNVYDWCADWWDYGSGPQTDPTGPSSGSSRVLRGGSWNFNAKFCRSAARLANDPTGRNYHVGFRLVLGR